MDSNEELQPELAPQSRRFGSRVFPFGVALLLAAASVWVVALFTIGPFGQASQVDDQALLQTNYRPDIDPTQVFDPFADEKPPGGYFKVFNRDVILPVYQPRFTTADNVEWADDADVIGITIDGEAKAYPVHFLSGREMVIDELAGEPLLVSW